MTSDFNKYELTDRGLKAIIPPPTGQATYYDTNVPGLALRVSAGGAKTFVLQRRVGAIDKDTFRVVQKVARIKIGRYPAMPLKTAREEARRLLGEIELGHDPRREQEKVKEQEAEQLRRAQEIKRRTFAIVRERFISEYCEGLKADGKTPRLRPKSLAAYRYDLRANWFVEWETKPITSITRADVNAVLGKVQKTRGGYTANGVLASLRKMMNWCVTQDLIPTAPTAGISKPAQEIARDRVLHERELFYLWQAFDASPIFAPVLKMLLVTAQRREEVAGLRRAELENLDGDSPLWRIPKERTKNGREHLVPLSSLAVSILGSAAVKPDWLFSTTDETALSGYSNAKETIVNALAKRRATIADPAEGGPLDTLLHDWRIHDFRRTAATCLAEIGAPRDVVELILNHASGSRSGVAGTYNRSQLLDERRAALECWAIYLERVTVECLDDRAIGALRKEMRTEYRRKLMDEPLRPHLQIVESVAVAA